LIAKQQFIAAFTIKAKASLTKNGCKNSSEQPNITNSFTNYWLVKLYDTGSLFMTSRHSTKQ